MESVYKNHRVIYEAANILKAEGIYDFQIIVTLDGQTDACSNIECCGILDREALKKEYSRSVLVFPSYIETVGLPLVEAMNVGALILAADCEYARETLDGYSNVVFFDPFSPKELSACMKKAINREIVSDGVPYQRAGNSDQWRFLLQN